MTSDAKSHAVPIEGAGPLAARMDQLERDYRRLRRFANMLVIGVAILLGLGVAFATVTARYGMPGLATEIVAARQFVLRGSDGSVRGMWGTEDDGTVRLVLQDPQGHPRVKLNLLSDGSSGVSVSDTAGRPRAVFALLPDNSGSLAFADDAGVTRTVLGVSNGGAANLVFVDRGGSTRAGLGVDGRGAGTFTLLDRGGRDAVAPDAESAPAESIADQPKTDSKPRAESRKR